MYTEMLQKFYVTTYVQFVCGTKCSELYTCELIRHNETVEKQTDCSTWLCIT